MSWKHYFTSPVGRKLVMAFTGLFLITFLIIHCYINAQIFWFDGGAHFNDAAYFMGSNTAVRTIEFGLVAGFLLHIVQGFMLVAQNRSKRTQRYAMKTGATSHWYSRSMGLLGTLILIFLIVHTSQFWIPNRAATLSGRPELNLYLRMKETFQLTWVVALYVLGCVSLAFHLAHGFYSAFQTLGAGTPKYKHLIHNVGVAFAIIVPAIFAMMPLAFYFGILQ